MTSTKKMTGTINLSNVSLKYIIGAKREDLGSFCFDRFLKRSLKKEIWALRDFSLQISESEIIGVVGNNGAGKTTLCRLLAGLLKPDRGHVSVRGRVTALLSLGSGFNNQLSARENIFLNGLMLGFTKKKIESHFDDIIAFSGLQNFIDMPLKNYSKGMRSRLAVSIAALIDPEILILDETLSTGDREFINKSGAKMQEMIQTAKIVLVVTHNMRFVETYCTKALWLEKGRIRDFGAVTAIVTEYNNTVSAKRKQQPRPHLRYSHSCASGNCVIKARDISLCFKMARTWIAPKRKNNSRIAVPQKYIWALSNLSFNVHQGEIIGIIGRNGAGKSTLCRVLAGILKTERGRLSVNGEIAALLALGTGFNIQLTGRDNILLNGFMLGIKKTRLKRLTPAIVQYSELEEFIDQPVKHYSSGMRARLGFSIASEIEPDILIIDELLGAGDIGFFQKASERIQELMASSKAVIVVSHNLNFIEKVCTRTLLIDHGQIAYEGSPEGAISYYKRMILNEPTSGSVLKTDKHKMQPN